jgi:hypothetical protein
MSKILTNQTKIVIWSDSDFRITTPSIPHISRGDDENDALTDNDIIDIRKVIESQINF